VNDGHVIPHAATAGSIVAIAGALVVGVWWTTTQTAQAN
jgi:hypothetical protein